MALTLTNTIAVLNGGENILIEDTTVYGGSNALRANVFINFLVEDMRTDPPSDITPSYDPETVTSILVTTRHDGWYKITQSLAAANVGVKGAMSFSLDEQPENGTFSNFYIRLAPTSLYTIQWSYGGNVTIGATTTDTAASMVTSANSQIVSACASEGVDVPVVVTSVGDVITFTTVEYTSYFNEKGNLYVLDKITASGSFALDLFTLITGGSYTTVDDDFQFYMTGGVTPAANDELVKDELVTERFCICKANFTKKTFNCRCGCENKENIEQLYCMSAQFEGIKDLVAQNDMLSADKAIERLNKECALANKGCCG